MRLLFMLWCLESFFIVVDLRFDFLGFFIWRFWLYFVCMLVLWDFLWMLFLLWGFERFFFVGDLRNVILGFVIWIFCLGFFCILIL